MKNRFLLFLLLPFCFSASLARAHSLWLNIDDDRPEAGQKVQIEIGWGHKFPRDEVIKEGFLNEVYALDSKGARILIKQVSPTEFEFVPTAQGCYAILANIHPGFLSKTTEGYKLQPKKGLENVVSCFRYDIRAKAVMNVGDSVKMPDQPVGDPLEIIPLKHGRHLKQGEILPVKVIYNGKALAFADVRATYAGFSDQPNTFALSTKTDKDGTARIKLLEKGSWLVNVMYEVPYPDKEECDNYRYNYSFTFAVQ
ncbi:MAG: DUF4198 domain-containing protein [Deltaproteobacteria bacterium]|nr:DUF4198 domain-containing protein [Deltaproteobacteria bacterium]